MDDDYVVARLSPLRKIIAARMAEAVRIPHFRLVADIESDAVVQLRERLSKREADVHPSLNDLIVKACAGALIDTPAMNVQWVDGEVRQYRTADISIIVAVEGGLSTPIVRRAETKSVWQIAREVRALKDRAATNSLRMDEVFGGTFSISNLGMYGVDQFDAIINPPQCAILAVGRTQGRCVVRNSEIRVASAMRVTVSIDHRVLDGAVAARFLAGLRSRLEEPANLVRDQDD